MQASTYAKSNIFRTWLLLLAFFIFVIGIGYLFSYIFGNSNILYIAVIFSTAMSFISYWYSDKIILALSKARPLSKEDYPEIYEIIENLCQKANLPLPKLYLLRESQPNAFATGRNKNHSAIALTQGLLEKLNRAEVEGVISHELSHIKNRDTLLQTMIVILVGFVAIISRWFMYSSLFGGKSEREDNGKVLAIIGLAVAILAPLAAILIQLAISRKREFLADASGADLTKNSEGLALALAKIAGDPHPLLAAQEATSHLYIVNPFRGKNMLKLFMTHPPVEERIKTLREMKF